MIIKEFDIDLNYLSNQGEIRAFTVIGDIGSMFSLVVQKRQGSGAITYYNFSTSTFTSTSKRLKNQIIQAGSYRGVITFPAGGLSTGATPITYTIMVFAESAFDTTHAKHKEERYPDGTLNINDSVGSNSSLMQKEIYQYPETQLTLSTISPNSLSGFAGMGVANSVITINRGASTGKTPFKIKATLGSSKAGKIIRQPSSSDITAFASRTLGEPIKINGVTGPAEPGSTINGTLPLNNTDKIVLAAIGGTSVGMTVTGLGINSDYPVVVTHVNPDGDNVNEIKISKAITVADNASSTTPYLFEDILYRRWNCSEIQRLVDNMLAFSGGVSAGTRISRYLDTTDQLQETTNADGSVSTSTFTITNFDVPALDVLGHKPSFLYGRLSRQSGAVTFDTAQAVAANRNVGTKFYGYGTRAVGVLHNCTIELTDLAIEIENVSTTVNDSNADGETAQTNITVASASGIMDDVSVMSGVNVTSTSVNPTVTTINGSILTVSPPQYLQNTQALTFKNAGRVINITGNINVIGLDDTDLVLRFDIEKLVTAS